MLQCHACESPVTAVQVFFSLFTDFENLSVFWSDPRHEGELNAMLDQLIAWARTLKSVRSPTRRPDR